MKPLKAIIFDNEWVLVKNSWDAVSSAAHSVYGGEILSGMRFENALKIPYEGSSNDESNLLAEYSAGRINGDFFWSRVLDNFGVDFNSDNVGAMKQSMEHLITDVDSETISFLGELKGKGQYRFILLSNATPETVIGSQKRHTHYDLMDSCYFSYEMGYRKPENGAFEYVFSRESLDPSECVFVDDKYVNRNTAESLGVKTINHKIGEGTLRSKLEGVLGDG